MTKKYRLHLEVWRHCSCVEDTPSEKVFTLEEVNTLLTMKRKELGAYVNIPTKSWWFCDDDSDEQVYNQVFKECKESHD